MEMFRKVSREICRQFKEYLKHNGVHIEDNNNRTDFELNKLLTATWRIWTPQQIEEWTRIKRDEAFNPKLRYSNEYTGELGKIY